MKDTHKAYSEINRIPNQFVPIMVLSFFSINILSLAFPLAMKKIYGTIIISRSVDSLRYIIGLSLLALLLEAIMRRFKETSSKWIASKYEYKMSVFLIKKLLSTYGNDEKNNNYITNVEKFKSIARLASFYSTAYYQLFIDVPFMFVFLYLIYLYGGILVWIPLGLSLVYILIVVVVSNKYFKSQTNYVDTNDQLLAQLIETLEKVHLVKASGIEESQVIKYKKLLDDVSKAEFISNGNKILPTTLASKFSQLTLFMILIGGGYLVTQNAISFGQITACAMLGGRAISPIIGLMRYYQQTQDIKILRRRIDSIAYGDEQYPDGVLDFPEDIYGAIEFIDLGYVNDHLNKKETLSKDIAFGDFVVIHPTLFPSYRGVINQIRGIDTITKGKILIDNLDIVEWNLYSLKGKIECLTENVPIFKGSVLDNITYFNATEVQSAFEAASLTGLDLLVSQMPEGFSTELDSHMLNYLSASFLQRLNLTRALLERPRILIFDRIDESMDQDTLAFFLWLLNKMKGKTTIIIASWNEEIIKMGDYALTPDEDLSA